MEWFAGIYLFVGIVIIVTIGLLLICGDTDKVLKIGLITGIVAYFIFVFMTEAPSSDEAKIIKIDNGKVVGATKGLIIAWDAPEYIYGIQIFKGFYLNDHDVTINYTIYYRIADEDLSKLQKYYDRVIKPGKKTRIYFKNFN